MRRRWLAVLTIAASLIAVLLWADWPRPPIHTQQNQQTHTAYNAKQDAAYQEKTFWEHTTGDPNAFFAFWVAIFTGVLAMSTIGLGIATYKLWRTSETHAGHMEQSVQVAREGAQAATLHAKAAIGVELPTIFVTDIVLRERGVANLAARLQFPSIDVTFKNFGRTPAFLVKRAVVIHAARVLPETPICHTIHEYPRGQIIDKGISVTERFDQSGYDESTVDSILAGETFLWVYGFLIYQDFLRTFHEIGFCARYFGSYRDVPGNFGFGFGPPKYTYARDHDADPQRL